MMAGLMKRQPYPSDISDDDWAFVAPYLTLMTEEAPQRVHPLRALFNAMRWLVRAGAPWWMWPMTCRPWEAVYQQTQRWLKAGVFEAIVQDLRRLLRLVEGRAPEPSATILDSRTLQSTPESGARAGYEGAKRKRGSQVHMAVDTLGHLLALHVTAADEQDRTQVKHLAQRVQAATGDTVQLAFGDQGYTGDQPAQDAATQGIQLEVVKLPHVKKGFVLLPRSWVVERRFAWAARFRRLARDDERLPSMLAGSHFVAFAILMAHRFIMWLTQSA